MVKRKRSKRGSEEAESTNHENAPDLVTFNVGGTKYQISRSLLDQHPNTMLSRMVSDTWQAEGDRDNDVFIERNGARFAFVLDYMRDGRVSLPGGNSICTKSSLLNELTYFGFENIPSDSIEVEFPHMDAPKYIARLTEDFQQERQVLVKVKEKLEVDIACLTVAYGICVRRMKSESEKIQFTIARYKERRLYERVGNELDSQVVKAVSATSLKGKMGALNKALLKFGLRVSSYNESRAESQCHYTDKPGYYKKKEEVIGVYDMSMTVHSVE